MKIAAPFEPYLPIAGRGGGHPARVLGQSRRLVDDDLGRDDLKRIHFTKRDKSDKFCTGRGESTGVLIMLERRRFPRLGCPGGE